MGSRAEHAILVHAHSHKVPMSYAARFICCTTYWSKGVKKDFKCDAYPRSSCFLYRSDGYKSLVHHALQKIDFRKSDSVRRINPV